MILFSDNFGSSPRFQAMQNESGFLKPLEKQEEYELFKSSAMGDRSAIEKLVNHNMRLVVHVAKRFSGTVEQEELISIGSAGLLKAVKTYNVEKGTQFSTYAAKCIDNEILMFLRANKKNLVNVSLFQPIGHDKDGNEITLMEALKDEDYVVSKKIEEKDLQDEMKTIMEKSLSAREYSIIVSRFGLFGNTKMAQRELAKKLNISRSYISRIEKKAKQKMKDYILNNQIEIY